MTDAAAAPSDTPAPRRARRKTWHYQPAPPVTLAPFWDWPLRPGAILGYLVRGWNPVGERAFYMAVAFAVWIWATPDVARATEWQFDWIFALWLRDMALILVVAGGLHLWLYTFRGQGDDTHYDTRPLLKNNKVFFFNDQLSDNFFWSMIAVLFWVFWEALILWAYANGYATMITFDSNPVWFLVLLFLVPYWAGVFFYDLHRLLHVQPFYRWIHWWHHKNNNTGPWSGLAMHPVESFFLMVDTLIYLVIAAHPVHVIFNLMFHGLGAPVSHSGYHDLKVGGFKIMRIGDFYHQLHHRFVDCNFGTTDTPWDQWAGTYHDGTPAGEAHIRDMRQQAAVSTPG